MYRLIHQEGPFGKVLKLMDVMQSAVKVVIQ